MKGYFGHKFDGYKGVYFSNNVKKVIADNEKSITAKTRYALNMNLNLSNFINNLENFEIKKNLENIIDRYIDSKYSHLQHCHQKDKDMEQTKEIREISSLLKLNNKQ